MNLSSRACFGRFVLSFIFGMTPVGLAQTTDYEAIERVGRAEYLAGHYERAEAFLQQALEGAEHSANDFAVARILNDLGNLYQNEDELPEAERSYAQALVKLKRLSDHPYDLTVTFLNLGATYSMEGLNSEARKVLDQAWKHYRKYIPADFGLAAQILNTQGVSYLRDGKIKKAQVLLERARSMRPAAETDPDMIDAEILHNLAEVHKKQRQYAEAEASYIRSLEIATQRLGPAHPAIPLMLVDLGLLYADTRRYSEAEVRFQDAVTLLEQTPPALNGRMRINLAPRRGKYTGSRFRATVPGKPLIRRLEIRHGLSEFTSYV